MRGCVAWRWRRQSISNAPGPNRSRPASGISQVAVRCEVGAGRSRTAPGDPSGQVADHRHLRSWLRVRSPAAIGMRPPRSSLAKTHITARAPLTATSILTVPDVHAAMFTGSSFNARSDSPRSAPRRSRRSGRRNRSTGRWPTSPRCRRSHASRSSLASSCSHALRC
jgi:hypothetical protein